MDEVKTLRCPVCGRADVRHSHQRRPFFDSIMAIVGKIPYRCRACDCRFYVKEREEPKSETEPRRRVRRSR